MHRRVGQEVLLLAPWGWGYTCADKALSLEVGVWELALSLTLQVCNPFHSDVQSLVASLLTVYLVAQDFSSALACCVYLVDWYLMAYNWLNPMIPLQLFTLADLLEKQAQRSWCSSERTEWMRTVFKLPSLLEETYFFGPRVFASLHSKALVAELAVAAIQAAYERMVLSHGGAHSFTQSALSRLSTLQTVRSASRRLRHDETVRELGFVKERGVPLMT